MLSPYRGEPGEVGHQVSRFTHPSRQILFINISTRRKYRFVAWSIDYLETHFQKEPTFCSRYFMENKNTLKKGETGHLRERWEKKWGEAGPHGEIRDTKLLGIDKVLCVSDIECSAYLRAGDGVINRICHVASA